jgi:hypothetical protein
MGRNRPGKPWLPSLRWWVIAYRTLCRQEGSQSPTFQKTSPCKGDTGGVRGGASGWARVKRGFIFPIRTLAPTPRHRQCPQRARPSGGLALRAGGGDGQGEGGLIQTPLKRAEEGARASSNSENSGWQPSNRPISFASYNAIWVMSPKLRRRHACRVASVPPLEETRAGGRRLSVRSTGLRPSSRCLSPCHTDVKRAHSVHIFVTTTRCPGISGHNAYHCAQGCATRARGCSGMSQLCDMLRVPAVSLSVKNFLTSALKTNS